MKADAATLRHGGIGLAAVLCAALAGWILGKPDDSFHGRPAAPEEWQLPQVTVRDPAEDLGILADRQPWGAGEPGGALFSGAPGPAAAAPPEPWRLDGIVSQADGLVAVILIDRPGEAQASEYHRAGDSLPDGSKIKSINPTGLVVDANGHDRTIRMFRHD